jgi:hypothetical protein
METRTTGRSSAARLRVVAGGARENDPRDGIPAEDCGIVCRYGVVVQHTDIAGLDLVEFEFSDAA